VLFEGPESATLNHLGVETENTADVEAAEAWLSDTGLETSGIDDTICCYATKVETWVTDPDGAEWEWYVKTGDSDQLTNRILGVGETSMCCAPDVSRARRVVRVKAARGVRARAYVPEQGSADCCAR
jgi:hypothetical protein